MNSPFSPKRLSDWNTVAVLLDFQFLTRVDFTSGRQVVNAQKVPERHVVAFGNLVRAVSAPYKVLVRAGGGRAFQTVFRHLETLPYIKVGVF